MATVSALPVRSSTPKATSCRPFDGPDEESAMTDPGLPDQPPPDQRPPGGDPGSVPDDPGGAPEPAPETPSPRPEDPR